MATLAPGRLVRTPWAGVRALPASTITGLTASGNACATCRSKQSTNDVWGRANDPAYEWAWPRQRLPDAAVVIIQTVPRLTRIKTAACLATVFMRNARTAADPD